jgi:hypothetical protein
MKASLMGWKDHIITCGHKHKSGQGIVKDPASKIMSHCLQVGSYKMYDRFAKSKTMPDQNFGPCVATIINPSATRETALVLPMWDIEYAADFLTHLRRKG